MKNNKKHISDMFKGSRGKKKFNKKHIRDVLNQVKAKGRNGDTELAHINPIEAHILKSLGGSGTINPKTGLREYGMMPWHRKFKPLKAITSSLGGGAGAVIGNMILPGVGGIIGGAIGQGAQNAARGKNVMQGALKGAGMGAALPSVASGLGWGATKLGMSGIGSTLSDYGTKNAILPALGFGKDTGSGIMGMGKEAAKYGGASTLLGSLGGGSQKGAGISAGDDTESYLQYLLAKEKKKDDMGFMEKLSSNTADFFTKPKNLLAVGSTGLTLYDRFNQPKPKSAAQLGREEKEKMLAMRLTPEELAAQEQYELMQEQARRRNNRKKYLPEEKIEIDPLYTRVSSPEERERTGRWLNYYNNPQFTGNPIRI